MKIFLTLLVLGFAQLTFAQFDYEPNKEFPYGRPNPEGPDELLDWLPLIGTCNCKSISRIDQSTWADTIDMIWKWKYIMNGMAVQDETLKQDGSNSGSIRQYNSDSSKWYVHYYSSKSIVVPLPVWEGSKRDDGKIMLYRNSPAPNGTPGFYRITFSNISDDGFKWMGEWTNKAETFTYTTWVILCKRKD